MSDHEIGVIAGTLPPEEGCRFLVDLANLRGGPDNITVVIVSVRGLSSRATPAEPAKSKRPWYGFIPWPLAALCVGGGEDERKIATDCEAKRDCALI